jgi:hypothetical protein
MRHAASVGFVSFPLDMTPPYSDQWNVSVQRRLGTSWMVSANYGRAVTGNWRIFVRRAAP